MCTKETLERAFLNRYYPDSEVNDLIYIEGIRNILLGDAAEVKVCLIENGESREITPRLPALTREERDIILSGCLINYYSK